MSGSFRRLAFAQTGSGRWGLGLFRDEQGAFLTGSAGPDSLTAGAPQEARLEVARAGWTVTGAGLRLSVQPDGEGIELRSEDGVAAAHARCRVTGELAGDLLDEDGGAPGLCLEHSGWAPGDVDSLREVAAWFEEGVDYGLLSLRPRKAKGHERDLVLAALLAGEGEPPARMVDEGRLSTTYAREGDVTRAGLELWLEEETGDGEGASGGEDAYPHRVAGERLGRSVTLAADGLQMTVTPFVWHSRGREGLGIYGLGRPS